MTLRIGPEPSRLKVALAQDLLDAADARIDMFEHPDIVEIGVASREPLAMLIRVKTKDSGNRYFQVRISETW